MPKIDKFCPLWLYKVVISVTVYDYIVRDVAIFVSTKKFESFFSKYYKDLTVDEIETGATSFIQFLGEVKTKDPFLLLNHFTYNLVEETKAKLGKLFKKDPYEGDSEKAADFFKKALNTNPSFGRALYNLGILYQDKGEFSEAADSFRESKIDDWKSRVCYCYYKGNNVTKFLSEFETIMSLPHWSPLLASLSAHYSKSYNKPDPYNFCSDPLKYVRKQTISVLADSGSKFRTDLINQLNELEIGSRKQGRLINGVQSAGNLLRRKEDVFRVLAGHILVEIDNYVDELDKDCEFLRAFPKAPSFQSSWFVKMQNQGHLTSHIHETGWLSGVVYLQIPDNQLDNDGKIQFGIDGDSYPNTDVTYPKKILDINEGDIVLFPSSVFHQTIPFKSKSERICIAFDISPP